MCHLSFGINCYTKKYSNHAQLLGELFRHLLHNENTIVTGFDC